MKVIVFDVPAEHSGALSILEEYYDKAVADTTNTEWIFIVSLPDLKSINNVKVLRFPWIKKSWLHRLFFDYFIAPKIVKKQKPDEILSLQNLIIPRVHKVKQTLYVHQALPFIEYKFNFIENKKLWVYQNIIGKRIKVSIKKADKVTIQTYWMKEACIESTNELPSKFQVIPPIIKTEVVKTFELNNESKRTFFYPAGPGLYKNHKAIVEACCLLESMNEKNYKVIFTLNGNENEHIINLKKIIDEKQLPFQFIGKIEREKVYQYYAESILVFPSYIESMALPLIEAKLHNTYVVAGSTAFGREVLSEYEKARFFNVNENKELAFILKEFINMNTFT